MKFFAGVIMLGVIGPSPHGEGGLKLVVIVLILIIGVSLPAWGGWIEMLPTFLHTAPAQCPSPHGEGGLKCYVRA